MRSLAILGAAVLVGCGGGAFEQGSSPGTDLAGAAGDAGAVSIAPGGASMLGGSSSSAGKAGAPASGGAAASSSAGDAGEGSEGGAPPATSGPCDVSSWTAEAFATSVYLSVLEEPAFMFDDDEQTRWASGVAREPGQWLELELGAGVVLHELELRTPKNPGDVPETLDLVLDGKPVQVAASKPSEGVLRLTFEATAASSARLELTSSAPGWWSVAELGGSCR